MNHTFHSKRGEVSAEYIVGGGNLKCRIRTGLDVFVRYGEKWEWYRVLSRGPSKGLEMFQGYVEDAAQVAVLEKAHTVVRREHRALCCACVNHIPHP